MAAKDDSSKKGEVNEGMGDMSQAAVKKNDRSSSRAWLHNL